MSRYQPSRTFQTFGHSISRPTVSVAPYHKSIYGANGTGRDSYISMNNGGLCSYSQGVAKLEGGTFSSPTKPQGAGDIRPRIQPKKLFYQPDGTGRDTYIGINSGGIHKEKKYAEFSQSFVEHLRNYDQASPHSFVSQTPKSGIGLRAGNYSDNYMARLYAMREYQRVRDFRLAQPKKKKTKYGNFDTSEEFRLNRTSSLSPLNKGKKSPLYKSFTFDRHMGRK